MLPARINHKDHRISELADALTLDVSEGFFPVVDRIEELFQRDSGPSQFIKDLVAVGHIVKDEEIAAAIVRGISDLKLEESVIVGTEEHLAIFLGFLKHPSACVKDEAGKALSKKSEIFRSIGVGRFIGNSIDSAAREIDENNWVHSGLMFAKERFAE